MGTMERQQRLNVVARIEDILDRYFGEVACLHVSQESETTRDRNSEDATYPTVPPLSSVERAIAIALCIAS